MHLERQPPSSKTRSAASRANETPGDFAGFVARNAAPAYRLAAIALDDPVSAQDAVHDALMAAWQAGAAWPARSLDAAFGRRMIEQFRRAVLAARESPAPESPAAESPAPESPAPESPAPEGPGVRADASLSSDQDLDAALMSLPADDLAVVIEGLALSRQIEPVADALGGRRKLAKRLPEILDRLAARLDLPDTPRAGDAPNATGAATAPGDAPARSGPPAGSESPLRGGVALADQVARLLAQRDPGDEPSQLRWRLQRSLGEVEQALTEQAEISSNSDWGFAIKFFALLIVGVLAISALSMAALRNQPPAGTGAGQAPAAGLIPARVAIVSPPGETQSIHVAATQDSLIAMVEASWQRDRFARGCQTYVEGLVDANGSAQWLGDLGVSVDLVAGDTHSGRVNIVGRDGLCARIDMSSSDGGVTWDTPRAASLPDSADWLAIDPARPNLVADAAGHAWSSAGGATWNESAGPLHLIGFDTTGRLVAWAGGRIVDSYDGGGTWLDLDAGPATPPDAGAALSDGLLLSAPDGLWWHPFGGQARLVQPGHVLAVQPVGDGAVAIGTDGTGLVWVATIYGGIAYPAALPNSLASLRPASAEIAGNDSGALVAISGKQSAIAFIGFQQ